MLALILQQSYNQRPHTLAQIFLQLRLLISEWQIVEALGIFLQWITQGVVKWITKPFSSYLPRCRAATSLNVLLICHFPLLLQGHITTIFGPANELEPSPSFSYRVHISNLYFSVFLLLMLLFAPPTSPQVYIIFMFYGLLMHPFPPPPKWHISAIYNVRWLCASCSFFLTVEQKDPIQ